MKYWKPYAPIPAYWETSGTGETQTSKALLDVGTQLTILPSPTAQGDAQIQLSLHGIGTAW